MTLKTAIPEINAHQRKQLLRMVLECLPEKRIRTHESMDDNINYINDRLASDYNQAIDEATANLTKLIET